MTHPSERTGWREALKVIASAWSIAFIILFYIMVTATVESPTDRVSGVRAFNVFISLVGAITGMGWLIYRSREKRKP